ncbi:hypothetical protein GIB67_003687, partial [Kingdonia uniflora]
MPRKDAQNFIKTGAEKSNRLAAFQQIQNVQKIDGKGTNSAKAVLFTQDPISIQKLDGKGTNNKCKGSSFLLKHLSHMFKAATTTRTRMHRKQDHNLIKSGKDTTRKATYNSNKKMAYVQVALVFWLTKAIKLQEALTKQIPPCRPTGIHEKIVHIRANTCAKKRAEEVPQNLDPKYSSILPNQDFTFTLVDEDMGDCKVKFKYASTRLGCGWRRFSTAHELVVGDSMVFHLVKPAEFKTLKNSSRSSEVSGGVLFWGNPDRESFDVIADGLRKNSELSNGMWTKYYDLCCSQNVFLHGNLLKQNIKLVDGVILKTVILGDGIKSSKLSTFINDFAAWDRSLEGLEYLGMNVGFLCTKLQRLENLAPKSEHE